jgi:hypothetical protein
MAPFKIQQLLLALFATAASSDRHHVDSLAVSHHSTSITLPTITLAHPKLTNSQERCVHIHETRVITSAGPEVATEIVSKRADADADGADAIRAAVTVSTREWVLNLANTIAMALLGLATLVMTMVFGLKQLRYTKTTLQAMLNSYNIRPRVNDVEMNDLEGEQTNSGGVPSVDPAQRASSTSSNTFLLEPGVHVNPDDQIPPGLMSHGQPYTEPASEDGFPHNGSQQREDEGQMPEEELTAASGCSEADRQDSQIRDLHDRESDFPIIKAQTLTNLMLTGRHSV